MSKPQKIARIIVEALRDGLGLRDPGAAREPAGYGYYELPTYLRKGIRVPGVATSIVIDGRRHPLH